MTPKQKRRIRDAKRRAAELELHFNAQIRLARHEGKEAGRLEGIAVGEEHIRARVLEHAGALYKVGKDNDANAVREVFRELEKISQDGVIVRRD